MSVKVLYTTHATPPAAALEIRANVGIGPREAGGFGLVASLAATGVGIDATCNARGWSASSAA